MSFIRPPTYTHPNFHSTCMQARRQWARALCEVGPDQWAVIPSPENLYAGYRRYSDRKRQYGWRPLPFKDWRKGYLIGLQRGSGYQ